MNDDTYCKGYTNGVISNSVVVVIMLISFVLAVVAIPLQIFGGG
jgi:hypothetical protein